MPYDPTVPFATFTHEIHTATQPAGVIFVGASNKAVVKFRVQVANSGLPATIDNTAKIQYPTVSGGVTTIQNLTTNLVSTPIAGPANVLFVKRITAINGVSLNVYKKPSVKF